MIKTVLSVSGMMCPKCEAHMNEAIKSAFKIKSVESSHAEKQTVIISKEMLDKKELEAAVSSAGYKLEGIKTETVEAKGFSLFGRR